jgi:hypothetical protein
MTLALTAVPWFSGGPLPKVKLTATSTTGSPNPIPNNTLVDVFRNHADGTRHRVLTEQGPRLIGGGWAWLDVHCPYNQAVSYDITANGFTAVSGPVFLQSQKTWLIPPSDPDRAVMVQQIAVIADRSTQSRAVRFQPIGGPAVFLTDGFRDAYSGSLTLRVTDEAPLRALFADDGVVLINTPGVTGWDLRWLWVQPGQVSYSNPVGIRSYAKRLVTIPFEESADPDVDLTPSWSSGDAADAWATSALLLAAYGSSLDLVTDTRL